MTATEQAEPKKPVATPAAAESVIIRPWPKIVFLYPTFIVSTIFFLLSWLELVNSSTLGNIFMAVLLLNLLVFSFDFSRIKSITIVIGAIATVLLVLWLDNKWEITNFMGRVVDSIDIQMNAAFYGFLSAGLAFFLMLVFINTMLHQHNTYT